MSMYDRHLNDIRFQMAAPEGEQAQEFTISVYVTGDSDVSALSNIVSGIVDEVYAAARQRLAEIQEARDTDDKDLFPHRQGECLSRHTAFRRYLVEDRARQERERREDTQRFADFLKKAMVQEEDSASIVTSPLTPKLLN